MAIELRDPVRASGPALPDLPPKAILALLTRCLFAEGYDEHLSGHVSWKQPDGTFLVDARGISWDQMTPDDVVTMDASGEVVEGRWGITPALAMHLEIHRRRSDVGVILHHHARFGTIWAAARRLPPIYDQTSALLEGGLALYEPFDGSVGEAEPARLAAEGIGTAGAALLGSHGVVVTGRDPQHAFQRAVQLEWRCRMAWHVEALGRPTEPMDPARVEELASLYVDRDYPELFASMAHRMLRSDPLLAQLETK